MTKPDPFAAAQIASSAGTAATPAADPFTGAADSADPFATSSDYRGDFSPSPTMDALAGRLLVMIPRSFDPEAKDFLNPGETRECYTVDLTVLSGGKMSWFYTQKGDAERGTQDEVKEHVIDDVSAASPYTNTGHWVPQGAIIGKLKKSHRDGRPFLGIAIRGPQKADRDRGVTSAQIEKLYTEWVGRGRQGNAPKFGWTMVDPTPDQRAVAIAWWREVGSKLDPINPSTAPKS